MTDPQPTAYAAVMKQSTAHIEGWIGHALKRIETAVQNEMIRTRMDLQQALEQAYVSGVRDGFAQGVAAEASSREEA